MNLAAFFVPLALALLPNARAQEPAPAFERRVPLEDLGLELELPPLENARVTAPDGPILRVWAGELHGQTTRIALQTFAQGRGTQEEPDQVADRLADALARDGGRGPSLRFGEMELLPGNYGTAPYLALVKADRLRGTDTDGELWLAVGVLEAVAYAVEVEVLGKLSEATAKDLGQFVRAGIRYRGKVRDAKWTKDEVEERWRRVAPEALAEELDKVIRTKNYIIFTNSAGGRTFADVMEKNYALIRKMYPFPEVPGRRLMPVFLFRLPEQYHEYLVKNVGYTRAQAERTRGVASGDWYATYYEAPNDEVHIHEATHQIFRNRLLLTGGGSWFQEGVAEFMSAPAHDIENFGRGAGRRDIYTPFVEFFALPSLLMSSNPDRKSGGSEAGDHYAQAASIVAFVHSDRRLKPKFQEFVRAIGQTRRSDVPAIERELKRLFDLDIAGFEAAWKAHYR